MSEERERETLEQRAWRLRAWIEASARDAARDPAYAAKHGITPQAEMSLFASHGEQPARTKAAWLRGAVTALLPRGWAYEILEDIGGGATLVLTGYTPPG